jgi:6-pyruvoyltetrahydropterin/6-carboxytetrahydropterin synthase
MYLVRIERTFSAAHSIVMGGVPEPVHGHDWRVAATFAGAGLDADGLLVDFHAVERALDAIVGRFHNRSLNAVPPFDRLNPTAELVARHIADELGGAVPAGVRVHAVSVGEAPGCTATYLGACAGAGE